MADLPVQPMQDYGSMIMSIPSAQSTIDSQTASQALTQQQTQGAKIANQRSQMQLSFLQSLMKSMNPGNDSQAPGPGTPPQGSPAPGGMPVAQGDSTADAADTGDDTHTSVAAAGLDPAHITAHAQNQFAVKDIWSPQELQQLQYATLSGAPGASEAIKAQHDARIHNAMAQAQLGASDAYDKSYAVAQAPEGAAMATLEKIHPDGAAGIKALAKKNNWDDDQTDSFTRTYSDEVGNAVHRYSGRSVDVGKDGVARDAETNQPVLGGNPAGLSANEHADLVKSGQVMVKVPQGDHEIMVPQWQASGSPSLQSWVNKMAGSGQTAQSVNANSAAQNAPPAPKPAPTAVAAPAAPMDPQLKSALADPSYKLNLPQGKTGVSASPADVEESKAVAKSRTDLLQETGTSAKIGGAALVYLNAAKTIMDKGGVTTGLGSNAITDINRLAVKLGMKGGITADPSNNIALVKNLVNAGLQNIKATFGPRVTANEVFLNLEKANPSANMPDSALNTLIKENSQIAQYDVDSAPRARAYARAGNDPRSFDDWNQTHFPKQNAVKIDQPTSGGAKAMPTGPKMKAYADAKFGGDQSKAQDFLTRSGYK